MRVVIIALLLRTSSRRDDEERVFERRETGADGHESDFFLTTLVCVCDEKRVPFLFEADVRARARKTIALVYFIF